MIKSAPVLTLCMLIVVAWGCGGGVSQKERQADFKEEVLPFLEESVQAMSQLKGYRMRGSMEISAGGDEATGSRALKMEMQTEVENIEERTHQHIRMEMGGLTTDAYIYEDYFYQDVPGQGWIKTSLAEYQAQNLATGVLGGEQLELIMETVENASVVEENEESRELILALGRDFLLTSLERFRQSANEEELKRMEEWMAAMEKAADGFRAEIRLSIGKDDHLIRRMEMTIEMKDIPQLGTYTSRMFMDVYDHNADIHIQLPREAEQAKKADAD